MEQATHPHSLLKVGNKWQVEYHIWNKVQETKSAIHQSLHFTLSFNKRQVGSGMRRKRQKAQFDNWPISAWELTLLRRRALWFPSSASPRTLRPPEHSHPAHVPQISQAPSTEAQARIEHTYRSCKNYQIHHFEHGLLVPRRRLLGHGLQAEAQRVKKGRRI